MNDKIGFIGLGIMGKPMAKNLIKKGCSLLVYDLAAEATREVVDDGAELKPCAEIGAACDIVFMILPNGDAVKDVLFGSAGVANSMKSGSLVVDMSSVTPSDSRACAERLWQNGVSFLDAPVSGGEPKAVDGTLAFMVGGSKAGFERAMPFFQMMGSSAVLIGENGSGSVAKLANQIIVNLTIAAVSEAMVLTVKAGVDPDAVYKAIRGGLAGSAVLDAKVPLMLSRNFKPGGKISINLKDMKNVLSTAHELDVPLPFASQLLEVMQALKVAGHVDDDHGGIVQYFERNAGVEVRRRQA